MFKDILNSTLAEVKSFSADKTAILKKAVEIRLQATYNVYQKELEQLYSGLIYKDTMQVMKNIIKR